MYVICKLSYQKAKELLEQGKEVLFILDQKRGTEFYYLKLDKAKFEAINAEQGINAFLNTPKMPFSLASEFYRLASGVPVDMDGGEYIMTSNRPVKVKDWDALMQSYSHSE